MTIRTKTFIGSSYEGLVVAKAIEGHLSEFTDVMVWTEGVFLPGRTFIETLEKLLEEMDYAVLVASPDDLMIKREVESFSMRDNVLLELGLFMAKLGRHRTYLVTPKNQPMHIPTDLLGVKTVRFDLASGSELSEASVALENTCYEILHAMRESEKDLSNAMRRMLIKRLLIWTTKIQEILAILQAESMKSLLDRQHFECIRMDACDRLISLIEEQNEDVSKLQVTEPYEKLKLTLTAAIKELPFPEEVVISNDDAIGGLLSHYFGGSSIQDQYKRRIDSLLARYEKWYDKYRIEVARDLNDFQSELIKHL